MNPTLERVTSSLISLISGGGLTSSHIVIKLIDYRFTTRLALATKRFLSKCALDQPVNTRYYIPLTIFACSGTSGHMFLVGIWLRHTVNICLHLCFCTLTAQSILSCLSTSTIFDFNPRNCITGTCNMLRLRKCNTLCSKANYIIGFLILIQRFNSNFHFSGKFQSHVHVA